MGTGNHNPNITNDVRITSSPPPITAFSIALLLVPLASNSLNGSRVLSFASLADAQDARDAGYISASTMAAATVAFSQPSVPSAFKVGYVDLVGSETYATALAACISADTDFFWVCITARTDAEIVAVSDYIEGIATTRVLRFMFQSDDTGLMGSFPSGLTGLQDNTRTQGIFHTSDSEWNDVAYVVNRGTYDPAQVSVPWTGCQLSGVAALSPNPTQTQRNTAVNTNNINLMLPYFVSAFVMDPGVDITGQPIEEGITADYLSIAVRRAVALMVVNRSNRGQKTAVDATGQQLVIAAASGVMSLAETAGHIEPGWSVVGETITEADLSNRELRFTIRGTLTVSGRLFTFKTYLSR
jgi:hypothetical protein